MSERTIDPREEEFPLVATHRDGAVAVKVWRNFSNEGEAYYSLTVGRTYTDRETGEPRETHSLQGADILKAQALLGDGYRTIIQQRQRDHELKRGAVRDTGGRENGRGGLAEQRAVAAERARAAPASAAGRQRRPRTRGGPER